MAITVNPPTITLFSDGNYTGANGATGGTAPPGSVAGFNGTSFFWQVPAITPAVAGGQQAGAPARKRIVYINGIGTPRAAHAYTVVLLSVVTGANIVGIYNQSGDGESTNIFNDLVQCLGDKTGLSDNPATNTLAKAVYDSCVSRVYLNIVAHSQGAIITSRGIRQGIGKLLDYFGRRSNTVRPLIENVERRRGFWESVGRGLIGANDADRLNLEIALRREILPIVEQRLSSYVSAQTFGGAGRFFPNGPVYRHVYNAWDPVPNLFGQGDIFTGPGRGARVEQITRNSGSAIRDFDDHSMDGVYLQSSPNYVDREGKKVDNNYIPVDMGMIRAS